MLPEPQVPVHPAAANVASSVTCAPRCAAAAEGSPISTTPATSNAVNEARLELMTASFAVVCKVPAGESTLPNAPARVNAPGQNTYVTRATG